MSRIRWILIASAITSIVIGGLAFEIIATQPVRAGRCGRAPSSSPSPIGRASASPSGSRRRGRSASARYLQTHALSVAAEGTRRHPANLNKNFKAWREGPNVWICPTNRIGPVYQFVFENGGWRFDGPVGILAPGVRWFPCPICPNRDDRCDHGSFSRYVLLFDPATAS